MKEDLKQYLEEKPLARERQYKDRALVHFVLRQMHLKPSESSLTAVDDLIVFARMYTTADRSWRQILERYHHLRGSDYDEKDELVEKKLEDLGYKPITP